MWLAVAEALVSSSSRENGKEGNEDESCEDTYAEIQNLWGLTAPKNPLIYVLTATLHRTDLVRFIFAGCMMWSYQHSNIGSLTKFLEN